MARGNKGFSAKRGELTRSRSYHKPLTEFERITLQLASSNVSMYVIHTIMHHSTVSAFLGFCILSDYSINENISKIQNPVKGINY